MENPAALRAFVAYEMLQALWKVFIAKRLTVFVRPKLAEQNVSVGLCVSVAN
jgi:hypothetical protein